jgi:ATP-dependent DNA helicase RecG
MSNESKNETLEKFKQGETKLLISTTVIEVGIDIKDANVIVVYNANGFGLAQLHQLRGRVGRGNLEGYCYLITNDTEKERLNALEFSNDGFYLAEMDLKLRGPGDYFSIRQSGIPDFVFADFAKDHELFKQISEEAKTLFLMQEYDIEIKRYIDKIIDEVDISMQLN